MNRVSIPWKSDTRALPDNYEMALRRLENTEKRLEKFPNSMSRRVTPQKFKSKSGQGQGSTFHTSLY